MKPARFPRLILAATAALVLAAGMAGLARALFCDTPAALGGANLWKDRR